MKKFKHVDALSVEGAVSILRHYGQGAKIIAGGTDLLGVMKNRIHPEYPELLVNIKTIPQLAYIQTDGDILRIGALTRLRDLALHPTVRGKYPALAQAADAVASPHIRGMGTMGGNLCQDCRCWYYRASKNYFHCLRKKNAPPGAICYAVRGDHRYHSIFGPVRGCWAVNPGDLAPALMALDARIITTQRTVKVEDFFAVQAGATTILEPDEILIEVQLPALPDGTRNIFLKYAFRESIDFPLLNCALAVTIVEGWIREARMCLNGVYNLPYRARKAESAMRGRSIHDSMAEEVSGQALEEARPMRDNPYLEKIARSVVKEAVRSCI